ncbi:type II toxin-antitoxin system HicB family antitoxin [Xenorhabdus innexi]|uniref:DNA repair protein n=1 Tax=Xenorhabdus innexi TaxID=290109 RepID=A0A1N6MSP9_9GAMM
MMIDGHPASVIYEAEIKAFRGEFLDVTGYCDFVAYSIEGIEKEGQISLTEYVKTCMEEGINPFKNDDKQEQVTYDIWFQEQVHRY